MSKPRDRKLMMEVMKHGASVFYHDDLIAVIQPSSEESLAYFGSDIPGLKFRNRSMIADGGSETAWVVRCYNGTRFGVSLEVPGYFSSTRGPQFRISHPESNKKLKTRPMVARQLVRKWPSLYKAFGELAEQHHCLAFIENQTEEHIFTALKDSPISIADIQPHLMTERLKAKIIEQHPECLRYMNQTHEFANEIIDRLGGMHLSDITEHLRTYKLCIRAVRDSAGAYRSVPNKHRDEQMQLEAVKRDGSILGSISNPSRKVMLAAVKQSPDAWKYIKDEKMRKKLKKMK